MTILMSGVPVFFHLLEKPEGLLPDALLCPSTNLGTLGFKAQEDRERDGITQGAGEGLQGLSVLILFAYA